MRTLDIINYIVDTTHMGVRGAIDSNVKTMILDMLNIEYQRIYNLYPWDNIKLLDVSTTTSTGVIILPHYVGDIRGVRINKEALLPVGEIFVNNFNPDDFDTAGTAAAFTYLANSPVLTQPSAATIVSILSSSTSDTSTVGSVRIEGLAGGEVEREELALNGTTEVNGTNSYTELISITKPLTTGEITVQDSADAELGVIKPDEHSPQYKRVQLVPVVDESTTVKFQCTRKWERLVSDHDSVLIPDAESAIIYGTIANVWNYLQNPTMEAQARGTAGTHLQIALNKHDRINARDMRTVPSTGMFSNLGSFGHHIQDTSITGTGSNQIYV